MEKYAIIGGQYYSYCHGFADSLHAAKLLGTRSAEYWDNWQGWHYPAIYRAADVESVRTIQGDTYAPRPGTVPIASRSWGDRSWTTHHGTR